MNQTEDRLTSLFTRTADAVEVHQDLQRLVDTTAACSLDGPVAIPRKRRPRRRCRAARVRLPLQLKQPRVRVQDHLSLSRWNRALGPTLRYLRPR